MITPQLEIACFNAASALIAAESGADRIEFAAEYASGGITPSLEAFDTIRKRIHIPIFILIRSRAGNFVYTPEEMKMMAASIKAFSLCGADGFVFGCLNETGEVDEDKNIILLNEAGPLPCTFHRAFDRTADKQDSLKKIIGLGFDSLLTSGGAPSAAQGMNCLKDLMASAGTDIKIMPGGGIRSQSIESIHKQLHCGWYHSAGLLPSTDTANAEEIIRLKKNLTA